MSDEITIGKGESCARFALRRVNQGLRISAKGHPALEELFKTWGGGSSVGVSAYGRYWHPRAGEPPLRAYAIGETVDRMSGYGGSFRMAPLGMPLILDDGSFNLSFIRLEGISSPTGIEFIVSGVFSRGEIVAIAEKLKGASKQFYQDYLLPVTINITMSVEEMRL